MKRRWVIQHTVGMCGVGKFMKIWDRWPTDMCPLCKTTKETAAHVWTCKDPRQDATWEKSIERLRTWMNDYPTHPAVTKAIIDNLSAWRKGSPTQPTTSTFLGLDLAIAAQSRVGWQLLLEGRQVLEWEAVQQRYFEFEESRKTGR